MLRIFARRIGGYVTVDREVVMMRREVVVVGAAFGARYRTMCSTDEGATDPSAAQFVARLAVGNASAHRKFVEVLVGLRLMEVARGGC